MQSLTLAAVIRELSALTGRRVVAVVARDAWEHHIQFEQDTAVVVCLHPDHNTLYQTARSGGREAPASPLTRTLARTLVGSRLTETAQAGLDRVAALRFRGRDRLGDPVLVQVILEFTGKGANVVVLEGNDAWAGKVVDRLRDDRSKVHPRKLHPGSRYARPVSAKTDLTVAGDSALAGALRATGSPPTWRRLAEAWEGMGVETAREVLSVQEAGTGGSPPIEVPETELAQRWRAFVGSVQAPAQGTPAGDRFAPVLVEAGGALETLAFVPSAQAGATAAVTRFDSVSEALQEAHFRFRTQSRDTRQSALAVNLQAARRRTEKALGALDRAESDDRDPRTMRRVGEALLAGAHALGKGETSAEIMLPDTGETVTVRLNPALSAADNAELYFKKARKADRSGQVIDDRRRELEETRDALEDLAARLAGFGEGEPDPEWLAHAKLLGVALPRGQAEQVRDTAPGRELSSALRPKRYDLGQGWEVMVGRSDKGNHVLTFELSRPDDTWMHASGCPGSHVVLRHDERGKEPPRDVVLAAAAIAAFFSKARGAAKVPVTVAAKRHVRRPRKAPIGQALVGEHKTVMVAPVDPDARRSR